MPERIDQAPTDFAPAEEDKSVDVVVVGDINPDVVVAGADPRFGQQERFVDSVTFTLGGSGALFAAACARLGLSVAMVAVVGDDDIGRLMLSDLARRGVDVSRCRTDATGTPTGATVVLVKDDDRAILTSPGAMAELTAEDVGANLVASARHVHVASYFLLPALRTGLPGLLARARADGASISLDPNWDPTEQWDAGLAAVLRSADLVLPNEEEAKRITRTETLAEALTALTAVMPRDGVVAIKRGTDGAAGADRVSEASVRAYPVAAVDAIGAGDAFDAGFIAAWLERRSLRECLRFAAVSGALSTRARGGAAAHATRAEVEEALAGWTDA